MWWRRGKGRLEEKTGREKDIVGKQIIFIPTYGCGSWHQMIHSHDEMIYTISAI